MVLLLVFLVAAWIASPLWVGLVLGAVLAFTTQPIYRRLAHRWHDRRGLAAAVVTVTSGVICTLVVGGGLYVFGHMLFALGAQLQRRLTADSLEAMLGARGVRAVDALHLSHRGGLRAAPWQPRVGVDARGRRRRRASSRWRGAAVLTLVLDAVHDVLRKLPGPLRAVTL